MLFIKYDNVLANAGLQGSAASQTIGVDEYNAMVVALGATRDNLRKPGQPPTVEYDGPDATLRAAETRVPVVGWTNPRDLDDSLPAGPSASEQNLYLRAQYATALTAVIEAMGAQKELVTVGAPASGALGDYSGQVAVIGDVETALIDPARSSSTTRVRVPYNLGQLGVQLMQGLDATNEQQRAAAEQRSVSATAQARAQTGLATAERLSKTEATERSAANLRAGLIGAGLLVGAYLWSR